MMLKTLSIKKIHRNELDIGLSNYFNIWLYIDEIEAMITNSLIALTLY